MNNYPNTALKIEALSRNFVMGSETVHALRGVSFDVKEGEFVAIMGSSGSGKSTLLNLLGCLDRPTGGEYFLDGVSVGLLNKNQLAEIRNHKIGFVFQSFNLLPRTTAIENVELPLMYNPAFSARQRRAKAEHVLELVGLTSRMKHTPSQLSGGQQQRVAIARALINDPVLILADEATGNLDTRTSYEILSLFQSLNNQGKTIVFVTHENEIASFTKRTVTLKDGRIIKDTENNDVQDAQQWLDRLPVQED